MLFKSDNFKSSFPLKFKFFIPSAFVNSKELILLFYKFRVSNLANFLFLNSLTSEILHLLISSSLRFSKFNSEISFNLNFLICEALKTSNVSNLYLSIG